MRIFDCCQAAEKYGDGLCAEWAGWEGQCMACGRGYLQDGITTNPLDDDDDDDDDDGCGCIWMGLPFLCGTSAYAQCVTTRLDHNFILD